MGIAKKVGPYLLTAEMNRFSIPPRKFPVPEFRNGMLRPINDAITRPNMIKIIDVTPLAAATPNINPSKNNNSTSTMKVIDPKSNSHTTDRSY